MKTVTSIAALLLATAAFAHGAGGEHLMGTVKAIDEKTITVETKDKKEVKVALEAATKFERDGKVATAKDAATGDRVVVHASKKEGSAELVASLVKLSAAKKEGP